MGAAFVPSLTAGRGELAAAGAVPSDPLAWHSLPRLAQIYVACVIVVGVVLLTSIFPLQVPQPGLFVGLLIFACVTSTWKVNLPLSPRSGSTLSVSYAANLATLLLFGPGHATIVAAVGVWTQCAVNAKHRYPLYRTVFSAATAIITIQATAVAYAWLGGGAAALTFASLPKPLVGAVAAYFCMNTGLVTGAIALSTNRPFWKVWHDDFFWSAPSFMVAGAAGALVAIVLERGQTWHAILMIAPVYLTYRTYRIFLGRLEDQRQHAAEARRLHDETLEALLQARRADQALVQEKERLAVTLRSVGDGVITTDLNGRVLLINEVAERLTGWSQEQAIGQTLSSVFQTFDPETRARRESSVGALISTDGPSPGRCTVLVARNLTEQPIEEIAAPLRDSSGRIIGMVLAFRDISDALRVQMEHAKASKLESLGLLAGGIGHDFNDILMTIVGNIAMARAADSRTGAGRSLDKAEQACIRARQLTWHLLSFAAGGVPVKETVSLASPINESVRLALRGLNLSRDVEIAESLWAVQADERQLVQAFTNVLVNAQEAMSQKGIIKIRGENTFEPVDRWENALPVKSGHYVRVSIADTGVGIPKEHLCRVFDPYYSTKQGGSGLGLATTYAILKDHGGYVSIESTPGQGTTVHLNFPALPIRSRNEIVIPHRTNGKQRVLVMDDEASNRILAVNMLQFLGYDADAVENGRLAVERFKDGMNAGKRFDVAMLDLMVPGELGGMETVSELAAVDPDVKAILVSGYARDPMMTEYRQCGFAAVLAKPYNLHELSMTIQLVIGASQCRVH